MERMSVLSAMTGFDADGGGADAGNRGELLLQLSGEARGCARASIR